MMTGKPFDLDFWKKIEQKKKQCTEKLLVPAVFIFVFLNCPLQIAT